jgi:hypothetical protein
MVTTIETPDEQPELLLGSWACTDGHHQRVSSRTGTVRYAEFTYSGPTPASYVDLEPGGRLSVLDSKGDPIRGGPAPADGGVSLNG